MSRDLVHVTGREAEGGLGLFSLAGRRLRNDMITSSVYLGLVKMAKTSLFCGDRWCNIRGQWHSLRLERCRLYTRYDTQTGCPWWLWNVTIANLAVIMLWAGGCTGVFKSTSLWLYEYFGLHKLWWKLPIAAGIKECGYESVAVKCLY